MRKILMVLLAAVAIGCPAKAAELPRYEVLTVKSVHDMWSPDGTAEPMWYIEYQGDILMYTDVNLPLETERVLADVSGDVPYIITPQGRPQGR